MHTRIAFGLALVALPFVGTLACGDDDETGSGGTGNTGNEGGTGNSGGAGNSGNQGGAGNSGGGGAATQSMDIQVVDFIANDAPVEGAGVALDLADDSRVEGLTGADGVVTLEWPADVDAVNIIAHKAGYSFRSQPVGMFTAPVGQPLPLFIGPVVQVDLSGYVAVTGTATNQNGANGDALAVFANPGTQVEEKGATTYEVLVPPSQDFVLVAVDAGAPIIAGQSLTRVWHSVVASAETGITSPSVIDLDFGTPTPSASTFSLSVAAPSDSVLSTNGVLFINTLVGGGPGGGSLACLYDSANSEYDCDGAVWDVGGAVNQTQYIVSEPSIFDNEPARQVVATASGGPPSGLVDLDFPNAPTLTAPSGAGPHALDTPIEYTVSAGGGAYDFVLLQVFDDEKFYGFAFLPPDSFTVPELPTGSDPALHYGADMTAAVFTCRVVSGNCGALGVQPFAATPPAN